MLLMATAICKNAPKNGAQQKSCSIKKYTKILEEMLMKQSSTFCAIYFMLVPLSIAQIGR
jgi:hypothetical protein